MSCEVCMNGYYSGCPCCSDDSEPSCDGEGASSGCEGCSDCVKDVSRTSYHTARRPHHGLKVGDKYARTTGFSYQIGGARTGYDKPQVRLVARGPNHPAVLVQTGVLPPVAQERAAIAARHAEAVGKVNGVAYSYQIRGEEANALLVAAKAVVAEVEAFVALHDASGTLHLRPLLVAHNGSHVVQRAEQVVARAAANDKEAERKARAAEWVATGGSYKAAGTVVTFEGREYTLGEQWSKWVARSNYSYMGESVDGEVVSGRDLLDPETGKVALRWSDKQAFPA